MERERQRQMRKQFSNFWFTPQMLITAEAGPDPSQEPVVKTGNWVKAGFLLWVAVTPVLEPSPIVSQGAQMQGETAVLMLEWGSELGCKPRYSHRGCSHCLLPEAFVKK